MEGMFPPRLQARTYVDVWGNGVVGARMSDSSLQEAFVGIRHYVAEGSETDSTQI